MSTLSTSTDPTTGVSRLSVGVDIGGTKIAGALVDRTGRILAQERRSTTASDPQAIEDAVVEMVQQLSGGHDLEAVGVAAAGFVDATRSTVYYAPNIDWRGEPVRQKLEARLHAPVTVENDANAAGWAEYRFGAGRGVTDMVTLTIGTGVGGAIISGGQLLRGGFGAAGELGHLRVVPDGLPCGCGARGCLEQYGSGRALQRLAESIADAGAVGRTLAVHRDERGVIPGDALAGLIAARDPGAVEAVRQLGTWLGQACASLAAVLDPQIFVFGGGVAQAGDLLLDPVRRGFADALPARGFHPEPDFAIAELVNDAGVVGAADLARLHSHAPLLAPV